MLEVFLAGALLEILAIVLLPLFLGWLGKVFVAAVLYFAWWIGGYDLLHVVLGLWAASYVAVIVVFGAARFYVADKLYAMTATLKDHSCRKTLNKRREEYNKERRERWKTVSGNIRKADKLALLRYIFFGQ
ncbi:hypothetical protein [Rhizobium sp. BK176]|uniref:hypothetical protein n=1 Tax=Rhizobium sp. BK176 TaxID=2587071 RepID=UPI00216A9355|nr:hypothetical protein [Rhizobium sp. BK176]MCS4088804.1 hypothetical protein [Rhizobium sp. BK176]